MKSAFCYIKNKDKYLLISFNNKNRFHCLGVDLVDSKPMDKQLVSAIRRLSGLTVKSKDLHFLGVVDYLQTENEEQEISFVFTTNKFSGDLKPFKNSQLKWVSAKSIKKINVGNLVKQSNSFVENNLVTYKAV